MCTQRHRDIFTDILSQMMMTEHTYDKIDLYSAICRTTSSYDFVRFTYTDIYGISRSKTVCKSGLEKFLTGGIGVHVGKFYFGICVAIGRLYILYPGRVFRAPGESSSSGDAVIWVSPMGETQITASRARVNVLYVERVG